VKQAHGWLWFFSSVARREVQDAQLAVNDAHRLMADTLDEIEATWNHLRPL
jgi:hypothetical protein